MIKYWCEKCAAFVGTKFEVSKSRTITNMIVSSLTQGHGSEEPPIKRVCEQCGKTVKSHNDED